jgi:hypothetical protein
MKLTGDNGGFSTDCFNILSSYLKTNDVTICLIIESKVDTALHILL